jgi:hypothetical protein
MAQAFGQSLALEKGSRPTDPSPPRYPLLPFPARFGHWKHRASRTYTYAACSLATLAALSAIEVAEVDSFVGRDMRFAFGNRHLDFTAENFLLSFSQPNFYFHATTAYDILRWKGLPIGKRDFTGKPRTKPSA